MSLTPLSRPLANEFSLYGARNVKATIEREIKLLKLLIRKNDETGLRRYLSVQGSQTKTSALNREQVVQVAAIFIEELEFGRRLADIREISIARVVNDPDSQNAT